jgi:hypothetical protein
LPRAVDQNGGGVLQGVEKLVGDVATNHGRIVNHLSDDNQPLCGWITPSGSGNATRVTVARALASLRDAGRIRRGTGGVVASLLNHQLMAVNPSGSRE